MHKIIQSLRSTNTIKPPQNIYPELKQESKNTGLSILYKDKNQELARFIVPEKSSGELKNFEVDDSKQVKDICKCFCVWNRINEWLKGRMIPLKRK